MGFESWKLNLLTKGFYAHRKTLSHKHRSILKRGHGCILVRVQGETFSEGGQDKWLNSTLLMRFKKVLSGFLLEMGHMALGSLGVEAKSVWSLIPHFCRVNIRSAVIICAVTTALTKCFMVFPWSCNRYKLQGDDAPSWSHWWLFNGGLYLYIQAITVALQTQAVATASEGISS